MPRRPLPLLIDSLPLYATKGQIMGAITASTHGQSNLRSLFSAAGFPKPNAFMDGYYVPAVIAFIEKFEADRSGSLLGSKSWGETSRRPA